MRERLQPRCEISGNRAEVFSVRFNGDGTLLATGCNYGAVRVYAADTGAAQYTLQPGTADALPITALRFRPGGAASKAKNILLAAGADGVIRHWHVSSSKCISKIVEPNNQVFAADYRKDGFFFATAGKDKLVRLYDESSRTLVSSLTGIHSDATPGHSNRVFAVKFDPRDDNLIVSGGWDNTIQVHDIRVGGSVRSIYGPHICGDSIDVAGDGVLLTGSWRPDDQLQLWDLGSGKLIQSIPWNGPTSSSMLPQTRSQPSKLGPSASTMSSGGAGDELQQPALPSRPPPCMLYAASFSHDAAGSLILAGGSGANEAKVFDRSSMLAAASGSVRGAEGAGGGGSPSLVTTITGLPRAVYSVDWHEASSLAICGGDGPVFVYSVTSGSSKDRDFNDGMSVTTATTTGGRGSGEAQVIDYSRGTSGAAAQLRTAVAPQTST